MMNPFGQLGELKKMRDQAMQVQRLLQAKEITVDKRGVHILITGDQKIKEIVTNNASDNDIKDTINDAVKQSQEVAAKELQSMSGGLSGLLGGMK
jgi:DNA-binding protein YbaB